MPRVSVIIPAHNAGRWIDETLASVEAQTYRDWEVVLANDCSTDDTAERARARGSATVVHTESNVGPAGARNVALDHASGELMALLDADDLWEPAFLERQVATFDRENARDGRVGIVTCDARMLLVDGSYATESYFQFMGGPPSGTLDELLVTNRIYGSVVTPMALVRELGGFAPETWGTEDHDLWLRIVETGHRVVYTLDRLAIYRQGPTTVSASLLGMARTSQATYRLALARGRLSPAQRRVAARQLRLQRVVEQVALVARERAESPAAAGRRVVRTAPLALRVAAENPRRWRGWVHRLTDLSGATTRAG